MAEHNIFRFIHVVCISGYVPLFLLHSILFYDDTAICQSFSLLVDTGVVYNLVLSGPRASSILVKGSANLLSFHTTLFIIWNYHN